MAKRSGPKGLAPPSGRGGVGKGGDKKKDFGGYKTQDVGEFANHAGEIKDLVAGKDFVEGQHTKRETRPAPFDRRELEVVRSWVQSRPLEPNKPASALISYPRMWTTNRGRYTKFRLPGAGVYGLVRS